MVRNGADGVWGVEDRWRLEEELRIGRIEGSGPDLFGRIQTIALDRESRIWVADGLSAEVRVFEPDGRFVRTVGRRGEGPGEFAVPMAMALGPDGMMWISDPPQGRVQVFDTSGQVVAAHPFPRGARPDAPVVFDSSGHVLHLAPGPDARSRALQVVRRDPTDFAVLETLSPVPPMGRTRRFSDRDGRPMGSTISVVRSIPFAHQPELRLLAQGSRLIGWPGGGAYGFGSLRLDGDTILFVERDYEPVPIPAAVLEARLGTLGRPAADALSRDEVPDTYPPFDEIDLAPDGHWWVRRTLGAERVTYEVFGPDGVFLGPIGAGNLAPFELMQVANDAMYGVWRGPLGTEYVVRLRVVKGASEPG